ncbi:DeoR family transcriptional regulator [Serratia fonticola]|uniref:DeoR family transcriptional regulator n=1 Tax=Serratia fonticola TaxID=47917 RepID=A0A559T2S2_SERFO|nr:DeoR/GlpR family DNA-binding transcription regulator [Serratia fonticola]TQI78594.1 DeoR family transcriptional regulator [Serratia fonticola]TQI99384.1 DeoR family transcriptional regulator [Serratia fonticola]TVZ68908.1 DeoR family transcriptional regulator [Serratia fonticola]
MSQQRSERIGNILHYLWLHHQLSILQAHELLGYAEATLRRDFNYIALHYPGMERYHGGLRFNVNNADKEFVFDMKKNINVDAKKQIALLARQHISPHDFIVLDSGTTCLELAKVLDMPARVVTTDVNIAHHLAQMNHLESYIIGGMIRPGYFTVGESLATDMLKTFSIEQVFISCDALSLDAGITNATLFEVGVKKTLIQRAKKVILLADHSKFEQTNPHTISTLSCVHCLITDEGLPDALFKRYRQAGVNIIR